jgi:hypothetical protein
VSRLAQEQIEGLRARIPVVTVHAAKAYPGLVISLDDKPIAPSALGTRIRVNPGAHRLRAAADGHQAQEKSFTANERDTLDFTLALAATNDPAPVAAAPASPADAGPSKLPGVLLIGGGGAALVAGAIFLVVAFSKDSAVDDLCGGPDRLDCPRDRRDDINSRISSVKMFQVLALGAGVVGAGGVGVGTYLVLRKPPANAAVGAAPFVSVAPALGPNELGVRAVGRF